MSWVYNLAVDLPLILVITKVTKIGNETSARRQPRSKNAKDLTDILSSVCMPLTLKLLEANSACVYVLFTGLLKYEPML